MEGRNWLPTFARVVPIILMQLGTRLRHGKLRERAKAGCIETVLQSDERVEELWEAAARDFDLIAVRDQEFLNWRYCDPRAGVFIARALWQGGSMLGYCIMTILNSRAYIADLLVRSGRTDVLEQLLVDAVRISREAEADAIVCELPRRHLRNNSVSSWLPEHPAHGRVRHHSLLHE